jgi:hypothetical protein
MSIEWKDGDWRNLPPLTPEIAGAPYPLPKLQVEVFVPQLETTPEKPKTPEQECERIALLSFEQFPVHTAKRCIAKKIAATQFRVNYLADDESKSDIKFSVNKILASKLIQVNAVKDGTFLSDITGTKTIAKQ